MDRGAWWATVPGIAKSQTRLSDLAQHSTHMLYTHKHKEQGAISLDLLMDIIRQILFFFKKKTLSLRKCFLGESGMSSGTTPRYLLPYMSRLLQVQGHSVKFPNSAYSQFYYNYTLSFMTGNRHQPLPHKTKHMKGRLRQEMAVHVYPPQTSLFQNYKNLLKSKHFRKMNFFIWKLHRQFLIISQFCHSVGSAF